ncbi:MAG: LVIVD repeat-containing protein [Candidatus Sericytochromatia bacterium]
MKPTQTLVRLALLILCLGSCQNEGAPTLTPAVSASSGAAGPAVTDVFKDRQYGAIHAMDNWLVLVDENHGLRILDAHSFEEKGELEIPNLQRYIHIWNDMAVLSDRENRIWFVDLSNPQLPTLRGSLQLENSNGYISKLQGVGNVLHVDVSFKTHPAAYGSDHYFLTYDLTSLSSPKLLSRTPFAGDWVSFARIGSRVYFSLKDNSIEMYDFSNPLEPVRVKSFPIESSNLTSSGNRLILYSEEQVRVYDTTADGTPVLQSNIRYTGELTALYAQGNKLYLAHSSLAPEKPKLRVFDLSQPQNPVESAVISLPESPNMLSQVNDRIYAVSFSGLFALTTELKPIDGVQHFLNTHEQIGSVIWSEKHLFVSTFGKTMAFELLSGNKLRRLADIKSISFDQSKIVDGILYGLGVNHGLTTYRVTSDAQLLPLANFKREKSFSFDIQMPYAYVGGENKLVILDISDPTQIRLVSEINGIFADQTFVKGTLLYGLDFHKGMTIYDLSNIRAPRKLSFVEGKTFRDVAFVGPYLYVLSNYGLKILDVSNPAQPKMIRDLVGVNSNSFGRLWLQGNRLYLTGVYESAEMSVSDPANPVLMRLVSQSIEELDFNAGVFAAKAFEGNLLEIGPDFHTYLYTLSAHKESQIFVDADTGASSPSCEWSVWIPNLKGC